MAEMDDSTMDLMPATPVFGEANAQQLRETVRWEWSGVTMKECIACGHEEEESNFMTAPCSHTYCGGCVNKLFDGAAKHEINFPPKCCGQIITLENAALFLPLDIYTKFQESSEEFSTTNRTYCSDPECATFISPKAISGDKAKCPACQKLTCIVCKAKAHEGDCPEDAAVQSLMTAAAEAGFQQCRKCKRIIELDKGCNHIKCVCGVEFCYVCGLKWKTCGCEPINEENRLHQAGEFDDREWEDWMDFAVDNVERIHEDGRIEWR